MRIPLLLKTIGVVLGLTGAALVLRTGFVAAALVDPGGASLFQPDQVSPALWRHLPFIRLFAALTFGVAAICIWGSYRLTPQQQASFAMLLAAVLGIVTLVAWAQQRAIWNTEGGWVLVGVLAISTTLGALAALASRPVTTAD